MRPSTLLSMTLSPKGAALLSVSRMAKDAYRASFLSGAIDSGLLRLLAKAPAALPRIAEGLGIAASGQDALESWLHMGVHLSVLRRRGDLYALGSRLARTLASEDSDAVAAILQEVVRLHVRLLDRTPQELGKGRRFTLCDQDGPLIARSSRALEPLVFDAVDAFIPKDGAPRLLEVGPGSGTYVRRAAQRNPRLTALAVELQPDVALVARQNLAKWGLSDRAAVEAGDIRGRAPRPEFDLATLHNNIYYFPVGDRPAVLRHVAGFLREGGRLLLTTACRGGSLMTDALDLWAAATEGSGRLPDPEELVSQLGAAGLRNARATRLVPGERYYAFTAER